jgi:hypothetical protein
MTTRSHLRRRSFTARGLTLAALLLAGTVHAKLVAAPGPDGAPPDPQTEAAVDALNDAIADGPDDGQSVDEWMMEVEAARDALYGTTLVSSTSTSTSTPTRVVDEGDMCLSPISLWTDSSSSQPVHEALATPSVRTELTDNLEEYLYGQLYLRLYGAGLTFGTPQITSLSCTKCPMTYIECLQAGNGWDWCKRHTLNCPTKPTSKATVTINVTAPVSGTVTLQANLRYRELDDDTLALPFEYCVDVTSFDTAGFGALDVLVRGKVENVVSDVICEQAWDWG